MARPLRIEYEGAFYHVTSRGNERKKIYYAKADYEKFKSYLKEAQEKYGYLLHCYVFMPNHYHLLIETPRGNMSKVMHYINGSYTSYINRKRGRSGHLFQGRYKAIIIDRDSYLLELSRYIHLNPVRAKIVLKPEDYDYSSYRSYVSRNREEIVHRDLILEMISKDGYYASSRYRDFVEKAMGQELENPLKDVYGGMILGAQGFIKQALAKLKEDTFKREEISYRRELQVDYRSDDVIESIAAYFNVSRDELFENKREYRNITTYLIKKYTGLTNKQIGQLFGHITYSAVGKAYQRFSTKLAKDRPLRKMVEEIMTKMSHVKG